MTLSDNAASKPSLRLREFEGPLDLLLDDVRRQNVAIEKIAMAPIVARFLEYMRTAAERNLDLGIEWLHMAATLIHWKSRSLLPSDASGEPHADPIRDDLVQQLLAYRKQAAGELARRKSIEEARLSRAADGDFLETPVLEGFEERPFVSVWDLIQQARELAYWVEGHRNDRFEWQQTIRVTRESVTVIDMIEHLRARLSVEDMIDCGRLLQDQPSALHRSCLFLGMLEMARDRQLQIQQAEAFGPMWLEPIRAE